MSVIYWTYQCSKQPFFSFKQLARKLQASKTNCRKKKQTMFPSSTDVDPFFVKFFHVVATLIAIDVCYSAKIEAKQKDEAKQQLRLVKKILKLQHQSLMTQWAVQKETMWKGVTSSSTTKYIPSGLSRSCRGSVSEINSFKRYSPTLNNSCSSSSSSSSFSVPGYNNEDYIASASTSSSSELVLALALRGGGPLKNQLSGGDAKKKTKVSAAASKQSGNRRARELNSSSDDQAQNTNNNNSHHHQTGNIISPHNDASSSSSSFPFDYVIKPAFNSFYSFSSWLSSSSTSVPQRPLFSHFQYPTCDDGIDWPSTINLYTPSVEDTVKLLPDIEESDCIGKTSLHVQILNALFPTCKIGNDQFNYCAVCNATYSESKQRETHFSKHHSDITLLQLKEILSNIEGKRRAYYVDSDNNKFEIEYGSSKFKGSPVSKFVADCKAFDEKYESCVFAKDVIPFTVGDAKKDSNGYTNRLHVYDKKCNMFWGADPWKKEAQKSDDKSYAIANTKQLGKFSDIGKNETFLDNKNCDTATFANKILNHYCCRKVESDEISKMRKCILQLRLASSSAFSKFLPHKYFDMFFKSMNNSNSNNNNDDDNHDDANSSTNFFSNILNLRHPFFKCFDITLWSLAVTYRQIENLLFVTPTKETWNEKNKKASCISRFLFPGDDERLFTDCDEVLFTEKLESFMRNSKFFGKHPSLYFGNTGIKANIYSNFSDDKNTRNFDIESLGIKRLYLAEYYTLLIAETLNKKGMKCCVCQLPLTSDTFSLDRFHTGDDAMHGIFDTVPCCVGCNFERNDTPLVQYIVYYYCNKKMLQLLADGLISLDIILRLPSDFSASSVANYDYQRKYLASELKKVEEYVMNIYVPQFVHPLAFYVDDAAAVVPPFPYYQQFRKNESRKRFSECEWDRRENSRAMDNIDAIPEFDFELESLAADKKNQRDYSAEKDKLFASVGKWYDFLMCKHKNQKANSPGEQSQGWCGDVPPEVPVNFENLEDVVENFSRYYMSSCLVESDEERVKFYDFWNAVEKSKELLGEDDAELLGEDNELLGEDNELLGEAAENLVDDYETDSLDLGSKLDETFSNLAHNIHGNFFADRNKKRIPQTLQITIPAPTGGSEKATTIEAPGRLHLTAWTILQLQVLFKKLEETEKTLTCPICQQVLAKEEISLDRCNCHAAHLRDQILLVHEKCNRDKHTRQGAADIFSRCILNGLKHYSGENIGVACSKVFDAAFDSMMEMKSLQDLAREHNCLIHVMDPRILLMYGSKKAGTGKVGDERNRFPLYFKAVDFLGTKYYRDYEAGSVE